MVHLDNTNTSLTMLQVMPWRCWVWPVMLRTLLAQSSCRCSIHSRASLVGGQDGLVTSHCNSCFLFPPASTWLTRLHDAWPSSDVPLTLILSMLGVIFGSTWIFCVICMLYFLYDSWMHFQLPNAAEGRLGVSASDGWMEAADKAMPSEMSRNDFKTSNHEKKVGSHARV